MIIGIDLGTTNSLAACFQDGRAVIIPNRLRKNLTPSIVAVDELAQILVGDRQGVRPAASGAHGRGL